MEKYKAYTTEQMYKKNALQNGYSGYVKNLPDGTVEAAVSCEDSQLDGFINILKQGSEYSVVSEIKQFKIDEIFNGKFQIR